MLTLLWLLMVTVQGNGQVASTTVQEEMTLKTAAVLVRKHDMFKDPVLATLRTGEIPADIKDVEHYQPQYVAFQSMGWIEMTSVKPEGIGAASKTRVALSEKGRSESKTWKQNRENEWQMPMATKEMLEVIKIHYNKDVPAGIEFFWTYMPNKLGEALKLSYQKEKAYATIQLLEDGWKIIKIRAIS
jgi:hypothetical protein